jgi:antitoxin component YwqK of YwqJK toxin-antitoxin module
MQSSFFEGKLHGRFTSCHSNGITEVKAECCNERLNGHSVMYDRAGNLRKEGAFIMGKRNGERLSYYTSGELVRCET